MLDRETVHSALGISEAYELPQALLSALLDDERRETILDTFLGMCDDLEHDSFTSYFQDEQGDRDALKQDFTPPEVCDLVAFCAGDHASYIDVCAGTGGLTISAWATHRDAFFRCEEYSSRSVPVLLLNLAMRNIHAEVIRRDVLTGETFAAYALTPGARFSRIEVIEDVPERRFGACIQNPPYSLRYDGERRDWHLYGTPPKSKADYAFVQYGLANVTSRGRVVCILPHGVLFRGQGEGEIRTAILDDYLVKTIIGLPDKLFRHTGIPVCILVLEAGEAFGCMADGDGDTYFIDAADEFEKQGKINVMLPEHLDRVRSAVTLRADIDKLAHLASYDDIIANGYNLNIPRYVDKYEPEPLPELAELFAELRDVNAQIAETERGLGAMMSRLRFTDGTTEDAPALEDIRCLLVGDGCGAT